MNGTPDLGLGSIFQKLVADYPLVIFYNQQCDIGINVNCVCAIIISKHVMLSFAFSGAEY